MLQQNNLFLLVQNNNLNDLQAAKKPFVKKSEVMSPHSKFPSQPTTVLTLLIYYTNYSVKYTKIVTCPQPFVQFPLINGKAELPFSIFTTRFHCGNNVFALQSRRDVFKYNAIC